MALSNNGSEPLEGNRRYQKVKDLNRGSYGFVQLAYDTLGKEYVAIKFMQRGEKIAQVYVEREIINHSMLIHPHIVQFKEVFLTDNHLAIAMEYAPGGDMFQYVKHRSGLSENEARWFFQQLVIALDYCHRMGVVSRDIKLENTLLDNSRRPLLKICDFGYSKHMEKDSVPKSRVGTPGYTAPEIISNRRNYDGKMVDVWSAGVMLYVMLFCRYPFERPDDEHEQPTKKYQKVLQRVIHGDYTFPSSIPVSDACKDLLSRILVVDPNKRIDIKGIQSHPWYLKDLPPGLNQFNDTCLLSHHRDANALQKNTDHVRKIVEEAKVCAPGPPIVNGSPLNGVPPMPIAEGSYDYEEMDDLMDNGDGSIELHPSF